MPTYFEKYGHTFITTAAFVGLATINGNHFDTQEKLISQHFAAQDKRLDRLADEVSELRRLTVSIADTP